MTKAALDALAFAHITGRMPKFLRFATWQAVFRCGDGTATDYRTKPECLEMAEAHPMTQTFRKLAADGWTIDASANHDKVRAGVAMRRRNAAGDEQVRILPSGLTS